jgi:hypothetical protein
MGRIEEVLRKAIMNGYGICAITYKGKDYIGYQVDEGVLVIVSEDMQINGQIVNIDAHASISRNR